MGLMDFLQILEAVEEIQEARDVVREGLSEALSTMSGMVGNEGQESVFESYVVPAFEKAVGPIKEGWNEVDIGDYMDFMGDIVGEGNAIMGDAYDEAQEILSEIEQDAIAEVFFTILSRRR